jgi:ABC-2 type transport system permease protein
MNLSLIKPQTNLWQDLSNFWQREVKPVLMKEWVHILNDPTTLRIAVIIPLFQLLIFGFAINNEVRNVPTYIFDQDRSQASSEFVEDMQATTYFKIKKYVSSKNELMDSLVANKAQVGVVIPYDYSRNLNRGRLASVQVLVDGSDSTVANQAQAALQQLGANISRQVVNSKKQGSLAKEALPLEIRPRYLFNPNLETPFFIMPALLGIIVFLVVSFLCCLSIVREKERGTLEQLLVTPLSPLGLMTGKVIPYIGIGFFDFNLSLFFMYVVFGIPVRGSLILLEVAIIIFMFSALGISLIISTVADNQAQAAQLTQMSLLPSIFLSGYVFPFDSMPVVFRVIGYLLPVTHFVRISRGIILRGAEFHHLMWPLAILLVYGVVIFGISVKIFRKEIG